MLAFVQLNHIALRTIRERSGLSVSALAALSGVGQSTLSNIELGRRNASPALIKRIADGLKIDVVAILADLEVVS